MVFGETTSPEIERAATAVVDSAYKIHDRFGPGLLESVYDACLDYELTKRGFKVQRQVIVPVVYDEIRLDVGFRLDLLVNDCLIVEVKAVERHNPLYEVQLLTYLKLTGVRLGILINFNVKLIK